MPHDRTPPAALDAEESVLGALLIGGTDTVGEVVAFLRPEHFYKEAHRRICSAVFAIYERGDDVDPTAIPEELRQRGDLERVGGHSYLAELFDTVATSASVAYHARIVTDRFRRRRLIEAGTAIVREAFDSTDGTDVVLDRAERAVMDVSADRQAGRLVELSKAMGPAFAQIEELQKAEGGITGIDTGFPDLNAMTGGLQKGDLIILAGRPSMGKTAIALRLLLNAALTCKEVCALFSLEMSKGQLVQRMLCSEGLVDLGRMLRGKLEDDDYRRLTDAANQLNSAPVFLSDSVTGSVLDVRAQARRLKREEGLGLIVVDYLQLMTGMTSENRNQEVSEITRGLKKLALELEVPIVALSQLSRKLEERGDKRPILSDLRDSGAIEQDADIVMFMYREEYYVSDKVAEANDLAGKAELIISKQRNGPTGTVNLFFRKECARFESISHWGVAA